MNTQLVAFDFGFKSLKMACFQNGVLTEAIVEEMPDNMVVDGQIVSQNAMSSFIADVAKSHGIGKHGAAVILPASQVYTRTITVPIMNESQLRINLPYEFKDYFSEDKSKYVIDYEVLETINDEEGNPKEQRLFACAALKEDIGRYESMFSRAGFKLKLAVPEEYIYSKLFRGDIGTGAAKEGAHALVDIGHSEIRIHILKDGEYNTKRTLDVGIGNLEKLIADITYSDIHVAHNYKLSNYDNILNHERVKAFYNQMAVEVLKAVNFYNYNSRTSELQDIFVIGGGIEITALINTLRNVTDVPVRSVDELLGGDMEEKSAHLMLRAICCGSGE